MTYDVRNAEIEAALKKLGTLIGEKLPEGWGFTLMLFNFGEHKESDEGMFYISNATRFDMIRAMDEFIVRERR